MVALNFMKEFVEDVEAGRKRQTIRENTRAHHGCRLQLYYAQRTKQCRKLGEVECISVQRITMMKTVVQPAGNTAITGILLEDFAKADGFKSYADMWVFFEPRAIDGEFKGFLIKW